MKKDNLLDINTIFAYGLLMAAQASISINVVVGKYVIDESMPVFLFLGVRFFSSSLFLTILMLLMRSNVLSSTHPSGQFQIKDWGFLLAQAFTGGFLFNYLFYQGVAYTTATSAGIISSALPAMIVLCAYLCLKEKLTYQKIMAIILATCGIGVISLDNSTEINSSHGSFWGDGLVLLAMLPEALYCIFNKFIGKRFTPIGNAMIVNWLIFLILLPLMIFVLIEENPVSFSLLSWILVILAGSASAFFFWGWGKGLLRIPVSTAAIFGGVMPVVTSFLGWLFLSETFGWYDLSGMLLIFASLFVGITIKSSDNDRRGA